MAYSAIWDETLPTGGEAANTIDDIVRAYKRDVRERLNDIFNIPNFATDPLRPYDIKFSATPAQNFIYGGSIGGFVIRNAANNQNNYLLDDNGNFTSRAGVLAQGGITASTGLFVTAGGITATGASTITGTLGGITTLTAVTLAGTLSTAAQPNVTSLGTLSTLTVAGNLTLSAAVSKIIPGVTSWGVRDNANANDNIIITNAGAVTFRSTVGGITTLTATTVVAALTGNASTATILATARAINGVNFDGSAAITVTAAAGTLTGGVLAAGVLASSLTSVGILASPHFTSPVIDSGDLTISTAISKIIPGVTSLSLRNNANNADNILITDAGVVTLRNQITIPGNNGIKYSAVDGGMYQIGNKVYLGQYSAQNFILSVDYTTGNVGISAGAINSSSGVTGSIGNGGTATFSLPAGAGGDGVYIYTVRSSNNQYSHGILTAGQSAGDATLVQQLVSSATTVANLGAGGTVGRTITITNNTGGASTFAWSYTKLNS